MRHTLAFLIVLLSISAVRAQDIAPRFQALAKNERFKLIRIHGTPELRATLGPTTAFSADGKRALYVEDLSGGTDEEPMLYDKGRSPLTMLAGLPGGKRFLVGDARNLVRLFDVGKEKPIQSYQTKGENLIWNIAVSADGKRFAASDFHSLVSIWDTDTG